MAFSVSQIVLPNENNLVVHSLYFPFGRFQFSGGRVICPGEVLESKEEKIVKEARTKQLLAAYNKKTGLNVDPKLKFEYEEVSIYSDHQILLRLFPSFIHGFPFYAHCWAFFLS